MTLMNTHESSAAVSASSGDKTGNLPAVLADTPPDLARLSQETAKPFYLVVVIGNRIERLPDEAFACGHAAARRAEELSEESGMKIQPRKEEPEPAPEPDEVPAEVAYDPDNPFHVRMMRLYDILSYRRPKGGTGEAAMIARYIDVIPGIQCDPCGNRYVCIGDQNPRVLWSCHTDTVHREDGFQQIQIEGKFLKLAPNSKSSCLGADDGAGIWIMLEMIDAQVPGLYVFHYGEESGCIGSTWLVENTPHLVEGIKMAIAFDRQGYDDVITYQMTGRCCSDAFARSLAEQLPGAYAPSPNGIYTDTAQYIHLIPECTNISVGYSGQHGRNEKVDVIHLMDLRDAMVKIDTGIITIARDPAVSDHGQSQWGRYFDDRYGGYGYYGGYEGSGQTSGSRGRISRQAYGMYGENDEEEWRDYLAEEGASANWNSRRSSGEPRSLVDLLEKYPAQTADVLEQLGFDFKTLWSEVREQYDV